MDTLSYERLPSQPVGLVLAETYRLLRRVGVGGMGEVYEAAHVRLPGRFAVKILLPDLLTNPEAYGRFCREAEIMSELRHPNIVQIFDFNTTPEGRPYFVMELLEGRDLESRLSEPERLPLPAVVRIVESVASALAAAHGHGVVHRDLKPANIFLATVDGQTDEIVKVLDFGISQVRAADRRLSLANHVLGTPPYMAPEQVRGDTETVDGRADQFALGAIAYRMLTGRDGFSGPDTPALLYQIVHEAPPPLTNFLPPDWNTRPLQAVLDRALAKHPDQRWGGMLEMARAFADAAERTVAVEEPDGSAGRGRCRRAAARAAASAHPGAHHHRRAAPHSVTTPGRGAARPTGDRGAARPSPTPGAKGRIVASKHRSSSGPAGRRAARQRPRPGLSDRSVGTAHHQNRSNSHHQRPSRHLRCRGPGAGRHVARDRLVPRRPCGGALHPGQSSRLDLATAPPGTAAGRHGRNWSGSRLGAPAMTVRIPGSSYRLQFNKSFTFRDATRLVEYLDGLGITDVYASPILAARPGSVHGYDVIEHARLNPEIGSEEDLDALVAALRERGMGMILDLVPNHMCIASPDNRWWNDVLENGRSSPYAPFFDIDWQPPKSELHEKVLLPVLGEQYGRVLESQEISIHYEGGAFSAHYYESRYPIGPRTILPLLEPMVADLRRSHPDDHADLLELESIVTATKHLPKRWETQPDLVRERQREKEIVKHRLDALVSRSEAVREALERSLKAINGEKGNPHSFDRLEAILADQAYRLSFWGVAAEEINYRRFFDINDLAAIRIEEPKVLAAVHDKAFQLLRAGKITGLRIDHVDGLLDPRRYLQDLQQVAVAGGAEVPPDGKTTYVVVEKILTGEESLPAEWPIHGTTGYEILNVVNGLFVDPAGARAIERAYLRIREGTAEFEDLLYRAKKLILRTALSSELYALATRLDRISEQHRWSRDFTQSNLHLALAETIACFPVYRTYVQSDTTQVTAGDRQHVLRAIRDAKRRNRSTSESLFDFLADVLLLRDPEGLSESDHAERREFVLRVQQLTGPVMAKGLEDTVFYRYYPLASLDEVGGRPTAGGIDVDRFHAICQRRLETWPHGLSATATHDTKRGEDTRVRLDVLSEIPREWRQALQRWQRLNRKLEPRVEDARVPEANEEYLIYQTLLGVWPMGALDRDLTEEERKSLAERVGAYMNKAVREAKVHSSWININAPYERGVEQFINRLLGSSVFLTDLRKFVGLILMPGHLQLALAAGDQSHHPRRSRFLPGDRALGFGARGSGQPTPRRLRRTAGAVGESGRPGRCGPAAVHRRRARPPGRWRAQVAGGHPRPAAPPDQPGRLRTRCLRPLGGGWSARPTCRGVRSLPSRRRFHHGGWPPLCLVARCGRTSRRAGGLGRHAPPAARLTADGSLSRCALRQSGQPRPRWQRSVADTGRGLLLAPRRDSHARVREGIPPRTAAVMPDERHTRALQMSFGVRARPVRPSTYTRPRAPVRQHANELPAAQNEANTACKLPGGCKLRESCSACQNETIGRGGTQWKQVSHFKHGLR